MSDRTLHPCEQCGLLDVAYQMHNRLCGDCQWDRELTRYPNTAPAPVAPVDCEVCGHPSLGGAWCWRCDPWRSR